METTNPDAAAGRATNATSRSTRGRSAVAGLALIVSGALLGAVVLGACSGTDQASRGEDVATVGAEATARGGSETTTSTTAEPAPTTTEAVTTVAPPTSAEPDAPAPTASPRPPAVAPSAPAPTPAPVPVPTTLDPAVFQQRYDACMGRQQTIVQQQLARLDADIAELQRTVGVSAEKAAEFEQRRAAILHLGDSADFCRGQAQFG